MHLPGDLILKKLKLPTACYEPGCPSAKLDMPNPFIFNYSAPLRRIVNPKTGLPSGYATPLFEMVRELRAAGVTIALNHELVGLSQPAANGKPILQIKTPDSEFPVSISPNLVLLNVPRARLLPLPGVAAAFGSRAMKALSCVRFDKPAGDAWKNWTITDASFTALSKAYLGEARTASRRARVGGAERKASTTAFGTLSWRTVHASSQQRVPLAANYSPICQLPRL